MSKADLTLAIQVMALIAVGVTCWYALKMLKSVNRALQAILEYRREIGWLTTRLDALEQSQQKVKGTNGWPNRDPSRKTI